MGQVVRRALSLISGGLDSLLATRMVLEQGIPVEGINFYTGFSGDHDYALKRGMTGVDGARLVSQQLGIQLHRVNLVEEFKPILRSPQYGYGRNLNPCLDCKLLMVQHALAWMKDHQFDFLITGEVVGQRPKSQRQDTLPLASRLSEDLIVRPLSAQLLPPTRPEREGWLDRARLGRVSGRGRKEQLQLAAAWGITEWGQPGGGCGLTDPNFCARLRDFWDYHAGRDYSLDELLLLSIGRHLRRDRLKVIVGRDEVENQFIGQFVGKYPLLQAVNFPGALILVEKQPQNDPAIWWQVAEIAAYFSKGRQSAQVEVKAELPGGVIEHYQLVPVHPEAAGWRWI